MSLVPLDVVFLGQDMSHRSFKKASGLLERAKKSYLLRNSVYVKPANSDEKTCTLYVPFTPSGKLISARTHILHSSAGSMSLAWIIGLLEGWRAGREGGGDNARCVSNALAQFNLAGHVVGKALLSSMSQGGELQPPRSALWVFAGESHNSWVSQLGPKASMLYHTVEVWVNREVSPRYSWPHIRTNQGSSSDESDVHDQALTNGGKAIQNMLSSVVSNPALLVAAASAISGSASR